jgi:hypothetical protein
MNIDITIGEARSICAALSYYAAHAYLHEDDVNEVYDLLHKIRKLEQEQTNARI